MKVTIRKDGTGFLAEIEGVENVFAYGETKEQAKEELLHVLDMFMDYHSEQIEIEQRAKTQLLEDKVHYAV